MGWQEIVKEHSDELIELVGGCFSIQLNANDFYVYACGDSERLDPMDLEWVLPIIRKYGYIDGTSAVMSMISRLMPIKEYQTEGFHQAMKEINEFNPTIWSRE